MFWISGAIVLEIHTLIKSAQANGANHHVASVGLVHPIIGELRRQRAYTSLVAAAALGLFKSADGIRGPAVTIAAVRRTLTYLPIRNLRWSEMTSRTAFQTVR